MVESEDTSIVTDDDTMCCPIDSKDTWKDVKIKEELSQKQRLQVINLLQEYQDVLTDVPGKTTLEECTLELVDDEPFRKNPYPVPYAMQKEIHKGKFRQLLAVGRWFPPGTPVSSTRKLISSSSFHRLDMTLAVAEALTPNKPNQTTLPFLPSYLPLVSGGASHTDVDLYGDLQSNPSPPFNVAMAGLSTLDLHLIDNFDLSNYKIAVDCGGMLLLI